MQELIKYQSIRSHIFKFKGERNRLLEERKRIVNLIKKTQQLYLGSGKIESMVYRNAMKSYTTRFAEIEERLSTLEAEEALKKTYGRMKRIFSRR